MRRAPVVLVALATTAVVFVCGPPPQYLGIAAAAALLAGWLALGGAFALRASQLGNGPDTAGRSLLGGLLETRAIPGAAVGIAAVLFGASVVAWRLCPLPIALAVVRFEATHVPQGDSSRVPMLVLEACALLVASAIGGLGGLAALHAVSARLGRTALGGLAVAAFAASAGLLCLAGPVSQGRDDPDATAWLDDLERAGELPLTTPIYEAQLPRRVQWSGGPPKLRLGDGEWVTEECEGHDQDRCTLEIAARDERPDFAHDLQGPEQHVKLHYTVEQLGRSGVEALNLLRDRQVGAWLLVLGPWRDARVLDARTPNGRLTMHDVANRFRLPWLAAPVPAIGLALALVWLGLGVRWARWSEEIARGADATITSDGWLEMHGHDPKRVAARGEVIQPGPVVVVARGARAPGYRQAPIAAVNFARGEKATLIAFAEATAKQRFATALALVVVTAAPLAAAYVGLR